MEAVTFYVEKPAAIMRHLLGDWRCRIERMAADSCNVVFFAENERKRFEEWAERNGVEIKLV
jgi:hypothetical protein